MTDSTTEHFQTTKRCSKCGENKSPNEFNKDARATDGLRSGCKACEASYYIEHREAILNKRASYDDKHREERRAYRSAHRKEELARAAKWAKENPDKRRAAQRLYRARKWGNGGTHTEQDIQRQGQCQKWHCWWCGNPCRDKYHVDHLIPLVKGGHNGPGNLVISCPTCNTRKKDKLPSEFAGMLL